MDRKDLREKIEDYISDWHWDDDSFEYAFELGKFLFSFIAYLEEEGLSNRTQKGHADNAGLIGIFVSSYRVDEDFSLEDLSGGPHHIDVFERKVSDSEYALQSYKSTWRKLDKYIKSGSHIKYLNRIEAELKDG